MRFSYSVLLLIQTLFTQVLALYITPLSAQTDEIYVGHECSVESYTSNSTYEANIRILFSSLSSKKDLKTGFYHFSSGKDDDFVQGYVLCRGDVSDSECRRCIDFSTTDLFQRCPTQKWGIAWYDKCMLAYSNKSGVTFLEDVTLIKFDDHLRVNESDIKSYLMARESLLVNLAFRASSGNSSRKFAVGDVSFSDTDKIYGLAQCKPDLDFYSCYGCLLLAIFVSQDSFLLRQRGRVSLTGGCDLRIAPEQISGTMDESPSPPYLHNPTTRFIYLRGRDPNTHRYIIVITVLAVCCVALFATICIFFLLSKRQKKNRQNVTEMRSTGSLPYNISSVTVERADRRKPQRGSGAVHNVNVTPVMEIPMLATQHSGSSTQNNDQDETSGSWILKTPINNPCPR